MDCLPDNKIIVPFLKWAGGKRWLISKHSYLFPENYNLYVEPFLGSGAVFFYLKPDSAFLNDINIELINTYSSIRDNWADINAQLVIYQKLHCKDFYYEMRNRIFIDKIERASQFIYLNRTCWNGLYRVNLKGKFNVPIGTKSTVTMDNDNFEAISNLLKTSILETTDFQNVIDQAEKGDFVFIDPPYTVKHNLNGFVKYNDKLFSWKDQIRLRDSIDRAVIRGVKVLLTNANHSSVRDLYEGIGDLITLNRNSIISGNAKARGSYSELVVKCYKK